MEGAPFETLRQDITNFKAENKFTYTEYRPELDMNVAMEFIKDNIAQTPEKLDAQYIENLLVNSKWFYSQLTRQLRINDKIVAINIACRLNDETAAQMINICDLTVDNIKPYTRWKMHQDVKRFGCHYMNIGSNYNDADLIQLHNKFAPFGSLKTHSWHKGKVSPFIDMNGIE